MIRRAILLLTVLGSSAQACSLCDPSNQRLQTFRQEARTSKFVVVGTLTNARLVGDNGYTDLAVETVVKDDPALGKRKTVTLPRWTPLDPKKPSKMMVFFDVYDGKLDPYRGITLRSTGAADYLKGALQLDDRDRVASLVYFFKYLDSADPDVAADAFLEFAKATDREIGAVAPKLDPAKVRKLLSDPKTPVERLGVFAYLLGACGTRTDAGTLAAMVDKPDDRAANALGGLLGGLIEIRPEEGWKRAQAILEDPKRQYQDKLSVLGTIRFFHAYQPETHHKAILEAMSAVISQGDMADMAIEDLRRWKWWDLSKPILSQYGKSTHSAPLVKNAILRYALCAPDADSAAFVKALREAEPKTVREVEESLEFERTPAPKSKP
jgi:hypothetical protein